MATYKVTFIFRYTSAKQASTPPHQRTGGWTESWYRNDTFDKVNASVQANGGLAECRARILPNGVAIIGYRIQSVVPKGASQSFRKIWPGDANVLSDIPQMALYVLIGSGEEANERICLLRGFPDSNVKEGEYDQGQNNGMNQKINDFFACLGGTVPWRFQGKNRAPVPQNIVKIDATGVVTTVLNHGYAIGNYVRIRRGVSTLRGKPFRGRTQIIAPVTDKTFKIIQDAVPPSTGGDVIMDGQVFPAVEPALCYPVEVVTRKVGAPFDKYHGRARRR